MEHDPQHVLDSAEDSVQKVVFVNGASQASNVVVRELHGRPWSAPGSTREDTNAAPIVCHGPRGNSDGASRFDLGAAAA